MSAAAVLEALGDPAGASLTKTCLDTAGAFDTQACRRLACRLNVAHIMTSFGGALFVFRT